MPITVSHPFVSTKPDKPSDFVDGKVTPTRWNQSHSISGAFGANEITNIPAGSVTSTNVQAAINQLASLIPSPGPGTDPLFLFEGLQIGVVNPTHIGDASDRIAARIIYGTDCSQTNPDFADNNALEIDYSATNGQATNNAISGGRKQTFLCSLMQSTINASGQKNIKYESIVGYGMSDTSIGQKYVQYAGGPVAGDEGQGFQLVSTLRQQNFLSKTTISTVTRSNLVPTTTAQAIFASKDAQTVNVVATAGLANGDWIVIEQAPFVAAPNSEAVQVISFTPTTITGVFHFNHLVGVTVTPALVLTCPSTFQMGQDRILVNLSQPAYTTGTVVSITAGQPVGNATNWSVGMVGGNAGSIGAFSFPADDCTAGPFAGANGPLKSWYYITEVTDVTHLSLGSFSAAGDGAYHGFGPGTGAYEIRPAVRILRIGGNGISVDGQLICDTSTSTWSVGDTVECSICPYADVNGFLYDIEHYTPGGAGMRRFLRIVNNGARTIDNCFEVAIGGPINQGQPTADALAFNSILHSDVSCREYLNCKGGTVSAIQLYTLGNSGFPDAGSYIRWDLNNASLGADSTTHGLRMRTILSLVDSLTNDFGTLKFVAPNTTTNPAVNAQMSWGGYLFMPAITNGGWGPGSIILDNVSDPNVLSGASAPVNFERSFWRWEQANSAWAIGTEKGGTGNPEDMILKTNNTEIIRLIAGGNIKFTAPINFSANGGVATSLTGVGPAGSHTTVQKWLTIVDDTGATVYIPCF